MKHPTEPMKPTTLEEAAFGGGGEELGSSSAGAGAGAGVASADSGGGGGEEAAEGEGGGLEEEELRLVRSAMTTITTDSFLMQLASTPLMK